MYLERITWGWSRQVGGRRAAAIPVAAGLGAHQPDWRLRLAAEPQAGGREVQAATIARKTLAYDFFRILRAPLFLTAELEREAELLSDHFIRWLIYAGMFATGTERQRRWYGLCVLTRQGSANGSFV